MPYYSAKTPAGALTAAQQVADAQQLEYQMNYLENLDVEGHGGRSLTGGSSDQYRMNFAKYMSMPHVREDVPGARVQRLVRLCFCVCRQHFPTEAPHPIPVEASARAFNASAPQAAAPL